MVKSTRESSLWENKKVLFCCAFIALANAFYGFDTASIGGLQAMPGFLQVYGYRNPHAAIGYSITTHVQQLIASLLTVGSIAGCLTTGLFAKWFGRRSGLWLGCVISMVANGVQIGATNIAGLYVGRVILGFSNAYFIIFSNVFISEISPHHLRAILISFFGFWVSIGTILGNVIDYLTKSILSKLAYRIPIACNFFFPLVLACGLFFLPESPRWLMLNGKEDAARKSLTWYRGSSLSAIALEEEMVEIERGIKEEQELAQGTSVMDLFRGTNFIRSIICWASIASHAATGVFVLISFNTFFFRILALTRIVSFTSRRD
jgi:MFS family permease